MAQDSTDPTTGAPGFSGTGAPDTAVDLTLLGTFAAKVGTRLMGTTATRTAYAYGREGLEWYDTDLDAIYIHDGSGWVLWQKRTTTYTPTPSNVSGSPTVAARYSVAAGVVHVEIEVTLAGANFGTAPAWSLPMTPANSLAVFAGIARMLDTSASSTVMGVVQIFGGNAALVAVNAASTYAAPASASATVPFTWASGDVVTMSFDYSVA